MTHNRSCCGLSLRAPLHQATKKGALVGSPSAHSFLNTISSGQITLFFHMFFGSFFGEKNTEKEWLAARDHENQTSSQLRSKRRRHNVLVYQFEFDFAVPNAVPSYLAGHHTGGVGTTTSKETAASESAATLLQAMSYGKPKELIMSDVEKPSAKEKAPAAN